MSARPFNAFAKVLSRPAPTPAAPLPAASVPAPTPAPAPVATPVAAVQPVDAHPTPEATAPAVKEQVANRWRDWDAGRARSTSSKPADPSPVVPVPVAVPIPLSAAAPRRVPLRPAVRPTIQPDSLPKAASPAIIPAASAPPTAADAPGSPTVTAVPTTDPPTGRSCADVASTDGGAAAAASRGARMPSPIVCPQMLVVPTDAPRPTPASRPVPQADVGDALSGALAKIAEQQALISSLVSTVASQCPACCARVVGVLTGSANDIAIQLTPRVASQHSHFHLSVDARPHVKGAARLRQKATGVRPNIGKRRAITRSSTSST